MTTIYIPRVIESQEQADSLPDGTVAVIDGNWPRILLKDETGQHWASWETVGMTKPDMTGWTALVPVEVDQVESQPLGMLRHGAEFIDRHPFTCYIDYKETP